MPTVDFRRVSDDGLPNAPMSSGVASVNNFDPILPARFKTWMNVVSGMPSTQLASWLDAMDVGLAATALDADGLPVYVVRQPLGRAWFVGQIQSVSTGQAALEAVSDRDFDPSIQAVVESTDLKAADSQGGAGSVAPIPTSDPNRFSFRSSSQTGGWLVVSATNYPGWQASVDGQPAQLYTADYVLSALWVPAGQHEVTLSYHSLPFDLGLLLAFGGLLIMVIWVGKRRRQA